MTARIISTSLKLTCYELVNKRLTKRPTAESHTSSDVFMILRSWLTEVAVIFRLLFIVYILVDIFTIIALVPDSDCAIDTHALIMITCSHEVQVIEVHYSTYIFYSYIIDRTILDN